MLRAVRNILLCTSPINKHLARVRFWRCPLPAIESGTSSLFKLIVTRSDKVVAQGSNPTWQKRQKKNPPGVGQTEVVARSNKLESKSISSRIFVRSDNVVTRSDKVVVVASINFIVFAWSDKQVISLAR